MQRTHFGKVSYINRRLQVALVELLADFVKETKFAGGFAYLAFLGA